MHREASIQQHLSIEHFTLNSFYILDYWQSCIILTLRSKQVTPLVEVIEGDPKVVLMEAAKRYKAEILVVGSHGYGAIQRFPFNSHAILH